MGQGSRLIRPRTVTGDGDGLVSHAGHRLAGGDRRSVGSDRRVERRDGRCAAASSRRRAHARPDGARRSPMARRVCRIWRRCAPSRRCSVRSASEATVWRTFDQVGPVELRGIAAARAAARERAWAAGAGPGRRRGDHRCRLDDHPHEGRQAGRGADLQAHLRSSPVAGDVRRDRRGPRRHPAGGQRRREHRRSITSCVLADALAQLPAVWRAGHDVGDDPSLVRATDPGSCRFCWGFALVRRGMRRPQHRVLARLPDRRPRP